MAGKRSHHRLIKYPLYWNIHFGVYGRFSTVFLLLFVFSLQFQLVGCALSGRVTLPGEGKPEAEKLRRAEIRVYGQSFMGMMYERRLLIENRDGRFLIEYSCRAEEGFEDKCRGGYYRGYVSAARVEEFLSIVSTLPDEGEGARCCDHPWTEMELEFMDGGRRELTVSFEPVDIEELFLPGR